MSRIMCILMKRVGQLREKENFIILFNELQRFLNEIETDNFTVSNSENITFSFTVSKIGFL